MQPRINLTRLSRFLSLLLRHKPEEIGLKLDPHGWGSIEFIIQNLPKDMPPIDRETILQVVAEDDKGRYALSPDGNSIRALQGHSVPVDLQLSKATPPDQLYHGTPDKFLTSILSQGLKPGARQHVHLSDNLDTAQRVAQRRKGKSVILLVNCKVMVAEGATFYISENGVWLTDHVAPKYLSIMEPPNDLDL